MLVPEVRFGKRVSGSWKLGWVLVVPLSPILSCMPDSVLKDAGALEGAGFGMLLKKIKALHQKASGLPGLRLIPSLRTLCGSGFFLHFPKARHCCCVLDSGQALLQQLHFGGRRSVLG